MLKQMIAVLIVLPGLNSIAAAQTMHTACALPAIADSISLKQIPGSDLVTVPVEIDGKPKQFLLAVSDNPTSVSQATVKELALTASARRTETFQPGSLVQVEGGAGSNGSGNIMQISVVDARSADADDEARARVDIASFTLGKAVGRNLQFVVAKDNEIAESAPYDGFMTGNFFKQYDVELDFAGMKLNYLTANGCADPGQVVFWPHKEVAVVPMTTSDGKIEVQVSIQGQPLNVVIDMSSARTVMRRDVAESIFGLKADTPGMMPAGDLRDGLDFQIYGHTFPQISFAGGVTAYNVPALIQVNGMHANSHREPVLGSRARFKADPHIPDLTLGMDVLRQLHLYIVHGQDSIYMTAAN